MKRLTVALQRLALHDLNTKFIMIKWFIKKWLSSKWKDISQAIRKPTRHQCGVGILDFLGMNLKSIQINHGHPATMRD